MLTATVAGGQINSFQKSYDVNGVSQSADVTDHGQLVIIGTTEQDNVFLLKTDRNGNVLWMKTYGDTLGDKGQCVTATRDGGFIIAANTFNSGAGKTDVWLIKTDSSGVIQWSRTYGTSNWEDVTSVRQTKDGGYIASGSTMGGFVIDHDMFLFKTDSLGVLTWNKRFGGAGYDDSYCVLQTIDNGYLLAGSTFSYGVGIGHMDGLLVKTDSNGVIIWSKTYGITGNQCITSVRPAKSGGYAMVGYTHVFGMSDSYVSRIDESGNLLWSKIFATPAWDRPSRLEETADGGYIIAGTAAGTYGYLEDGYLVRIDSAGQYLWGKVYDRSDNDHFVGAFELPDGAYLVAGNTLITNGTQTANQAYILNIDASGNTACNETPFDTIATVYNPAITSPDPTRGIAMIDSISTTLADSVAVATTVLCLNGVKVKDIGHASAELVVYPNPTYGVINFTSSKTISSLRIFDVQGKPVITLAPDAMRYSLDFARFPPGLYFYEAGTKGSIIKRGKVLRL